MNYKGISFQNFTKNKSIALSDIDLVKRDLYIHLFTRRGERVKMPNFGTSIPDMLFEPMTEELLRRMYEEVSRVIEYDPRVKQLRLVVIPFYDRGAALIVADLLYVELDLKDTLHINIEFRG